MDNRKARPRRRPRSTTCRPTGAMRAATLILVASGASSMAALSTLGFGVGFGVGVGVLAESAGISSDEAKSVETKSGEPIKETPAATAEMEKVQPILKPLVLDDFATVVHHVTEPILQTEKDDEEGDGDSKGSASANVDDKDDINNDDAAVDVAAMKNNDGANKEDAQHERKLQPATTASEALHDDSLASIPPLPSDLIKLPWLGEYEHGQQQKEEVVVKVEEKAMEEGRVGAEQEGDEGGAASSIADEVIADTDEGEYSAVGTLDETSGAIEDGDADAEQQDEIAEPSTSESAAGAADTAQEQQTEPTVDQPVDGEPAMIDDATSEDSPKNRVVVDYASKAAGALVLEKSPNLKGTSNLLNNDNDKYAIAPCDEERKYVVIGLSEDILVKQVVLANYERYSSHPKEFQVLGSQTYPDSTWIDLGTYTAQPGNNAQTFDLIDPTWARYLKLRFITHYGAEHYCTVSEIKVHGSTMLQGFHEQWKESEEEVKKVIEAVEGEDDDDLDDEDDDEGEESSEEEEEEEAGPVEDMVETSAEDDGEEGVRAEEEDAVANTDNDGVSEEETSASDESVEGSNDDEVTEAPTTDGEGTQENEGIDSQDDTMPGTIDAPVDSSQSEQMSGESANISQDDEQQTSEEGASNESAKVNAPKVSSESMSADVTSSDSDAADTKEISQETANSPAKGSAAAIAEPKTVSEIPENTPAVPSGSIANDEKPDESSSNILTPNIDASFGGEDDGGPLCIPYRHGTVPTMCADVNISDLSADPFVAAMNNFNRNQSALSLTSIARESADSTMSDGTVASMIGNLSSLASVSDAFIRSSIDKASNVIRGVKDSDSVISTKNKMKDTRSAGSHHAVLDMIDDSAFQPSKKTKSLRAAKTSSEKESGKKTPPAKKHEEPLVPGAMDAEVFAALASKYPAASCLKDLNYQEFKTKIIEARAKKKPAVVEKANGPPQPGKIEPIFKTLTDEIKSLQLSQSVYDQYIKAVTSCYQRIILDVTNELKTSESVQAERLSLLEDAIRDLQSQSRGHSALESVVLPILALIWFAASSLLGALANLFQPQNWFVAAEVISDKASFGSAGADGLLVLAGIGLLALLFVSLIRRKSQRRLLQPRLATNGDKRQSRSAPDLLA